MSNEALEKFNALMQEYVNKSYDELLSIANNALGIAMEIFNGIAKDGNGAPYVVPFMSTTLAIDGKFTELEYKFLNDLLGGGVDYDAAKANVQAHYSDDAINFVDQIIDACPAEMKAVLLTLVTCFAAVDETVSVDEKRFILKLMA